MKNPLYKAIVKSVSGRLSTFIIQFAALAIYARLFSPEEFGVIASIQVFVIFFQMLSDVGIGPAIINEEHFGEKKRNGIFTVTAILGGTLAIIFYFFSFALNELYGGYQYQDIAILVSISIFFYSLLIIPSTAMNKDTKFIEIAIVDIIVEFIILGIVYSLYLAGFGILAIASKPMFHGISKFILLWFISAKTEIGRPYFGKEIFHFKSILRFSSYQFGFNFINYFSRNLDNILIAKYFGMTSVGIYEKSYQLMRYPLLLTTFAMTPAIQPVLVKVRENKALIVKEHNLLTMRLLLISLPISFFMWINSRDIILFILGETWIGMQSLLEIFAFTIPIQAVLSTSGSFYQVMNKPKLLFFCGLISAFTNVTGIVFGIYLGSVESVAFALLITFSINFVICYFIMFKYCFDCSSSSFYRGLLNVFFILAIPLLLYYLANFYIESYLVFPSFFNLAINGILMLVVLLPFYKKLKSIAQL